MRFAKWRVFVLMMATGVLASGSLSAQASASELDKLINNYSEMSGFRSDFRQTKTLTTIGMELKGSGSLRVNSKTKDVLWQVKDPSPLAIKITTSAVSVISNVVGSDGKVKEQTQTFSLKGGIAGNQIAASIKPFLDLFSGDAASLHKQFKVERAANGFSLVPNQDAPKQLPIKSMTIVPDSDINYIVRVVILEKSGDTITYDFEKPVPLEAK